MWGAVVIVGLVVVGCGSHREPPASRGPLASQEMRCTLRIAQRRIFVDGEPTSRAGAVAYCAGTAGAIVVIEANATTAWDNATNTMVVIDDKATEAEWGETRAALQREGVRIYVRGPLCYDPRPDGCRPRLAPEPTLEIKPRLITPVSPPPSE